MRQSLLKVLTVAVLVGIAGCHSARRSEPITGPMPIFSSSVAQGRLVFQRRCHQCHPGGEGGLGPALNDKPLPPFLVKTQVRLGLGAMPEFHKQELSPEELDQLTAYLRALRAAAAR